MQCNESVNYFVLAQRHLIKISSRTHEEKTKKTGKKWKINEKVFLQDNDIGKGTQNFSNNAPRSVFIFIERRANQL
jgi:hypothetical protein